jgi:multiple sugar transport system permease protein
MRLSDSKFGFLLSMPGATVLFLWILIPFILLVATSFLRFDNIRPIVFYGVKNYKFLLGHRVFWLSFKNTLIFCVGVTSLTFVISLILAHSLSRITRGSSILRSLAMFPWAVPMVVSGFMWAQMFNPSFGVINDFLLRLGIVEKPLDIYGNPDLAMIGVIIADAWTRIPFMTIIILAGLESIDPTLYEAARVDGADTLQIFRHISLPLNHRAMLTGVIITTIFSFRTIDTIFSMTFGGPAKATYTFGFYVLDYIYRYFNFGVAGAMSIVMLFLLLMIGGFFIFHVLRREKG